jgi:hypothetical protein
MMTRVMTLMVSRLVARHNFGMAGLTPKRRWFQFSLRSLLGAVALASCSLVLIRWSMHPGQYLGLATEWEQLFVARLFTFPVICGLFGGAIGLLANHPWTGSLVGLAISSIATPFLVILWLQGVPG